MKNQNIAIVISLSYNHIHYCKALIASIEHFNPSTPIIIIKDGNFNTDVIDRRKNISVIDTKYINEFHQLDLDFLLTKLNIFFLPQLGFNYEYFIHMDADSVLTNPLSLNMFSKKKYDFFIFQGNKISYHNEKQQQQMNHYAFDPNNFPEYSFNLEQLFFFSSSHIAINKRIIPLLTKYLSTHRYEINKILLKNKRIRFNDQGFLNLVINVLSNKGEIKVKLDNCGIYGKDKPFNYPMLTVNNIKSKMKINILFIHFTGPSRKVRLKTHNYGDILSFFVKLFYNENRLYYNVSEFIRIIKYYYNWFAIRIKLKLNKLLKQV